MRIAIDETTPAIAMERLPMAFRLGEPISDGEKRRGMSAESEMARRYDDVFRHIASSLEAAPPGNDTVGFAPN